MTAMTFVPTDDQRLVIGKTGSAFIAACPGAGKTRVMVERARKILSEESSGRGIAFLSFTIAAVSELEERLRREGLVGTPAFPHFIGTFDAFLWQFLIAPFGVDGCNAKPRLIPDKDEREIKPHAAAQALPLGCFDRSTGNANLAMLRLHGFNRDPRAHETAARTVRARFLERGELDFVDARTVALARLRNPASAVVLRNAFAARFQELIVDEAQDCNPADLEIIDWFRTAGVPVKVICDPNQAIYSFRGGVTRELDRFAATFDDADRLHLSGNFRSSANIAKGIVALRAPDKRMPVDEALGVYRAEPTAVQILSYPGVGVPSSIGVKFRELTAAMGLSEQDCPVVSPTRRTSANALGHPQDSNAQDLSYRLAVAVSDFHFSYEIVGRKEALIEIHKIMLEISGHLDAKTYHQYISDAEIAPDSWRPEALALVNALRFDPARFATIDAWLDEARRLIAPLLRADGRTVNQRLRRIAGLEQALSVAPNTGHPARTIHSVKGMEFPAICVVMSSKTAKAVVDFLVGNVAGDNEDARKLYVGASRAQRLLAIALPRSQATRLRDLMLGIGGAVDLTQL